MLIKKIIKKIEADRPPFLCNKGFKNFLYFTLDFFRLTKYYLYILKNYDCFSETKKMKNIYKGHKAFVLAGGPSLKKLNFYKVNLLQKDSGYKVFCLSSYISTELAEIVTPDFYIVSDPAFLGDNRNISEEKVKEIEDSIKNLEKLNITLFLPVEFKGRLKIKNTIFYFNDCEFRWFNKNVTNILKPRSYLSMTAYKALAIACYMGFDTIYICGFDNNWIKFLEVDKNNDIYYDNPHGYKQADAKKLKMTGKDGNNVGELLYRHSFLFLDLYKFPKNIINLDPESLVDAFSKVHDLDIY